VLANVVTHLNQLCSCFRRLDGIDEWTDGTNAVRYAFSYGKGRIIMSDA